MIRTLRAKRAVETVLTSVDFSGQLADDAQLSGTPTVDELYTGDLTISGEAIDTTGTLEVNWEPVASGKAITFIVAGGTAGAEYTLRITVATDDGQTLMRELTFKVN